MKALFAITLLAISTCTFAASVCDFNETTETEFKVTKISKNPNRFTFREKNLIHRVISLQNFASGVGREEALNLFEDGEIIYFENLVLVHYFPGDTEVGAYFEESQLVATVGDSYITCVE